MIKIAKIISMDVGNDHVHTWRSDGELTELEVILYALTKRIYGQGSKPKRRIELTDHDNVKAWSPKVISDINEYISNGVELWPNGTIKPENPGLIRSHYVKHILTENGFNHYKLNSYHKIEDIDPGVLKCGELMIGKGVELTANLGPTFHILGLLMSRIDKDLEKRLDNISEIRRKRAKEMIGFLYSKDYFFYKTLEYLKSQDPDFSEQQLRDLIGNKQPITFRDVNAVNPESPTRLTVGFLLWKKYGPDIYWRLGQNKNKIPLTPEDVRELYFKRSYKSKFTIPSVSVRQAIEEINRNGGIAVLAHPNEDRKDRNYDWLTKGFDEIKAMGYDPQELIKKNVISEKEYLYGNYYGLLPLFIKWGLNGVESKFYAGRYRKTYGLRDFSYDKDYHGPEIKKKRKIMGSEPIISLESLLNSKLMMKKHNDLLESMQSEDNPAYSAWRISFQKTNEIVSSFPPEGKRTAQQDMIVAALPMPLKKAVTFEQYLNMAKIYEKNTDFKGTVLKMEGMLRDKLVGMISSSSYLNESDRFYNGRISSHLNELLEIHIRGEILRENLPFLHNIGKILTFGIEEINEPNKKADYQTTFVQHDLAGKELIESIRKVLKEQGFTDKEIDYMRDVTYYHVNVHKAVYNLMDKQKDEKRWDIVKSIIKENSFKPDVVLDSLLLINATGKMAYSKDLSQYSIYQKTIDQFMKVCVDMLPN